MDSTVRALVDLRDRQIQKARIQFSNRLAAIERGDDPTNVDSRQTEIVERWLDVFNSLEKSLDSDIKEVVSQHPIYDQLTAVKGIGPMMAAKLIALIDIERADKVSGLWRYAGLAVFDGEREKPVKGERLHYSKRMKSLMYNVASQFIKSRSPYTDIYYQWKDEYEKRKPDWTPQHRHLAAIRKMNKVFLEHLWRRWRGVEGLDAPRAWIYDIGGHVDYEKAEDYGWPMS